MGLKCVMLKIVLSGLLCLAAPLTAEPLRFSSGPARVALIELYTSEGCSSCPPADQWLGSLTGKSGLWKDFVPVEFHVNYWDSLSWRDRLSSREYTDRQYAYSAAWGSQSVYTPCFVRNGVEWRPLLGVADTPRDSAGILSVEMAETGFCRVRFMPVPGADHGRYDVHLAVLGGGLSSKVTAGENGGRTLKHEFVVIGLAKSELAPDASGQGASANVAIPGTIVHDATRRGLAAWVVQRGDLVPLQATGGWLP